MERHSGCEQHRPASAVRRACRRRRRKTRVAPWKPRLWADCPFVALGALRHGLLLQRAAEAEQKSTSAPGGPLTWPPVRGRSSEPSPVGRRLHSPVPPASSATVGRRADWDLPGSVHSNCDLGCCAHGPLVRRHDRRGEPRCKRLPRRSSRGPGFRRALSIYQCACCLAVQPRPWNPRRVSGRCGRCDRRLL